MAERPSLVARTGIAAWTFVGLVVAISIVVVALAAVSSLALPMLFAAVLAVLFRPVVARLEAMRWRPSLAAGAVLLALLAVVGGITWATIAGILNETDRILDQIAAGLAELDVPPSTIDDVRQALEDLQPTVAFGFAKLLVSGLSTLGGFTTGLLLGSLIMYYLLKDGPALRIAITGRFSGQRQREFHLFVGESIFVLRRYWLGRTIVSAIVASVVALFAFVLGLPLVPTLFVITFIGGYVPYIGAFIGGLFAVVVALGSEGVAMAVLMLVVVLAANLVVENLVDPVVTGRTLQIHPLVVLLVTTAGGIVGGLVGLVMAVPLTVIAVKALRHLRNVMDVDTAAVRDTVRDVIRTEATRALGDDAVI